MIPTYESCMFWAGIHNIDQFNIIYIYYNNGPFIEALSSCSSCYQYYWDSQRIYMRGCKYYQIDNTHSIFSNNLISCKCTLSSISMGRMSPWGVLLLLIQPLFEVPKLVCVLPTVLPRCTTTSSNGTSWTKLIEPFDKLVAPLVKQLMV